MKLSFLLNWYLNPYHAPIIVAKEMGFYKEVDIDLALLEPTDPSDVTHIIGKGEIPLGLKAMVHCYAARARGFKIKALGTLLDEPPTGLISFKHKNINTLNDIKGKRLGYVGEFGKVMIDNLAKEAGLTERDYTCVRIGMHATQALAEETVDAAIGLSNFQQVELAELGYETQMLRIDKLANLGCCCFCSILFIAHEALIENHAELITRFMKATYQGLIITREAPTEALSYLHKAKPNQNSLLFEKIFHHSLPYFSHDLRNVERDWVKVGAYVKKLGITQDNTDYQQCYTNQFV